MIQVQKLTKRFKKVVALSAVDLEVKKGDVVALWGPNGAGKTTLLRCLLGIIPFDGSIRVLDKDVTKMGKEVRRHIGYVPQEIRLHPDQTVLETVIFYARLRNVSCKRPIELIAEWGLEPSKDQPVRNLSGGMKQKLALIIALLSDPPILFLDEPTSNLDARTRYEFDTAVEKLKSMNKTLMFCSHRFSEVRKIADRVVVLEAGVKKAEGKPESVKEFLSDKTLLRIWVGGVECVRAAECLAQHGMEVKKNGSQIWVRVPSDQKAEPIRLLLEQSIPVVDFEVER